MIHWALLIVAFVAGAVYGALVERETRRAYRGASAARESSLRTELAAWQSAVDKANEQLRALLNDQEAAEFADGYSPCLPSCSGCHWCRTTPEQAAAWAALRREFAAWDAASDEALAGMDSTGEYRATTTANDPPSEWSSGVDVGYDPRIADGWPVGVAYVTEIDGVPTGAY
jgi:hypothetical protein